MIKKLYLFVMAWMFTIATLSAQETFKLMFYNLLNFPLEDAVPNRIQYLDIIIDDYIPDIFMVCELNNQQGADTILSLLQFYNPNFQSATFEFNTSDDNIGDQNDLQQLIYYDSSKFILESQTIVTTIFRDFNHFKLKLNTNNQATNPVVLDVIVCHLKASSGTDNEASRLQMVSDLVAYLDTFPVESNVLLAGDFNVYTHTEPAFQELIDVNNVITFIDPADRIGSWHNNSSFVDVMTQSTRTQTGLGGTTGGFDDRFDFIMTSESLLTNPELSFVAGSYDVYGNNANSQCYNQSINSSDCAGDDYSFFIRDALHSFSDHLPVILELQTNQSLSLTEVSLDIGISIVDTNAVDTQLTIRVEERLQNSLVLTIYNSLGQVIKSINVNTTLIDVDTSQFSNGIYYIASEKSKFNPLKFIVTH
ncbi:Por secretion system C-terminal sorting domain-containing protein [Formosa sp. Hel1_31_208]|uniref:T9SS type A sorting domain-containing protein n=1 Tax=Formosa sp. Hel1_31_208 TaxID=1798225 RepID=UPI00087D4EB7|nr:T9SS type A sorting domain-containing protein [Formosa sp. Hel1_31_208]SDS21687.1 Por secretion system C-terminal sorting domain-containing protein [Formosa sp. Hel1_31_208]